MCLVLYMMHSEYLYGPDVVCLYLTVYQPMINLQIRNNQSADCTWLLTLLFFFQLFKLLKKKTFTVCLPLSENNMSILKKLPLFPCFTVVFSDLISVSIFRNTCFSLGCCILHATVQIAV